MTRFISTALIFAVTAFGALPAMTSTVEAGWGWKKPLNQKMGAFYTSNRNPRFNHQSQRTSTYSSQRAKYSQKYSQPVYTPAVPAQQSVKIQTQKPAPQFHGSPIPSSGFIPARPVRQAVTQMAPQTGAQVGSQSRSQAAAQSPSQSVQQSRVQAGQQANGQVWQQSTVQPGGQGGTQQGQQQAVQRGGINLGTLPYQSTATELWQ